jgi:hypothetical protein
VRLQSSRSLAGINRCDAAPTPTGFAELVIDYFPVLQITHLFCGAPKTPVCSIGLLARESAFELKLLALLPAYLPNDRHGRVIQHLRDVAHHLKRLLLLLQNILQVDVRKLCVITEGREALLPPLDLTI